MATRGLSLPDYAQGELRGTAAQHQPGDLMPVHEAGVDLGQRAGDAQTLQLSYPPVVDQVVLVTDYLVVAEFHCFCLRLDRRGLDRVFRAPRHAGELFYAERGAEVRELPSSKASDISQRRLHACSAGWMRCRWFERTPDAVGGCLVAT